MDEDASGARRANGKKIARIGMDSAAAELDALYGDDISIDAPNAARENDDSTVDAPNAGNENDDFTVDEPNAEEDGLDALYGDDISIDAPNAGNEEDDVTVDAPNAEEDGAASTEPEKSKSAKRGGVRIRTREPDGAHERFQRRAARRADDGRGGERGARLRPRRASRGAHRALEADGGRGHPKRGRADGGETGYFLRPPRGPGRIRDPPVEEDVVDGVPPDDAAVDLGGSVTPPAEDNVVDGVPPDDAAVDGPTALDVAAVVDGPKDAGHRRRRR